MKLFEHPDFEQAILRAAEHFGLRAAIIEKDYYVVAGGHNTRLLSNYFDSLGNSIGTPQVYRTQRLVPFKSDTPFRCRNSLPSPLVARC